MFPICVGTDVLIDSIVLSTIFFPFFLLPPDFFFDGVTVGLLGEITIEVVTGDVNVVVTIGVLILDVDISVCGWF